MRLAKIFFAITLLSLNPALRAEGQESHGGDTVDCKDVEGSPYKGYYNLDYLLTYRQSDNNQDIANANTWEQSRDRIQNILNRSHPTLARSFAEFLSFMNNRDDYTKKRIWEEGAFGLVVVKPRTGPYQLIDRLLPKNCYDVENGEISLIRTITRKKKTNLLVYSQDLQIINKLPAIQLSFLYVHEWLRDITNDEEVIRRINRLLHSSVIEAKDYDLRKAIANIGVGSSFGAFVPVCERSPAIKGLFEAKFSIDCSKIDDSHLQSVHLELDFGFAQIPELRSGDFSGIPAPYAIDLSHNLFAEVPEGTFFKINFHPSIGTNAINLSHGRIRSVSPWSFVDLFYFSGILNLSHNEIQRIEKNTFVKIVTKESQDGILDLSYNSIEDVESGAFAESKFTKIIVDHNKLKTIRKDSFGKAYFIYLRNNEIESIEDGALFCDGNTFDIHLEHNKLLSIPDSVIDQWASPKCKARIHLFDNPISRDKEWIAYLTDRLKTRVHFNE